MDGVLLRDSEPMKGGLSRYTLDVDMCGDTRDSSASGGGMITVFSQEPPQFFWGQRVTVPVRNIDLSTDGMWTSSQNGTVVQLGWDTSLHRYRAILLDFIRTHLGRYAAGESEFLMALLLGIRDDPADPLIRSFREAGASHVLALSGMHLGIVAALILFCVKPLLGTPRAYLLSLPLLAGYIWLVGLRPSLLRAGIMYFVLSVKICGGRRLDALSVLAVACVTILCIDPISFGALSFRLSFLALLGIMTVGTAAAAYLSPYLPRWLSLPISMSVGAQAGTLPVVASQFGVFYPIGVITSVVISPLIVVYLWTGILFVLLSLLAVPFPYMIFVSNAVLELMAFIRTLVVFAVSLFARIPALPIDNWAAPGFGSVLGICVVVWRFNEYRSRYRAYKLRFTENCK